MMRKEAEAFIANILAMRDNADDKLASRAVGLYQTMNYDDALIKAGTRINWEGSLKRASVDLYDAELNNPANAPTLWEDIQYYEGYRIIPETITAGLAFSIDEIGYYNRRLYMSLIDANVWTPTQDPSGWEEVE